MVTPTTPQAAPVSQRASHRSPLCNRGSEFGRIGMPNGHDTVVKYTWYLTSGVQGEATGQNHDPNHRTCDGCGISGCGCGTYQNHLWCYLCYTLIVCMEVTSKKPLTLQRMLRDWPRASRMCKSCKMTMQRQIVPSACSLGSYSLHSALQESFRHSSAPLVS
jgi:hypothetical protein